MTGGGAALHHEEAGAGQWHAVAEKAIIVGWALEPTRYILCVSKRQPGGLRTSPVPFDGGVGTGYDRVGTSAHPTKSNNRRGSHYGLR